MPCDVLRWITLSVASLAPVARCAGGEGLSTDADRAWARLQGRISYAVTTAPSPTTPLTPGDGTGLQVQALSLMGDYYFGRLAAVRSAAFAPPAA